MSNLASISFDFSRFSHQGAYFSSYTPQRIEDYLHQPFIPPNSAYHLVACLHPQLMTRSNIDAVVTIYLNASEIICSKTIIDLCLPFYDDYSRRTFLGRYIIFEGNLLGIRLSTNVDRLGPQFSAWPRHKAKIATVQTLAKTCSILIGQIALYLINLRIGLLFEQQVETSAQEYLNCGFDVIALCYEGHEHDCQLLAYKECFLRETVLLQAGGRQEISESQILALLFERDTQARKGKVFIDYYSFEKLYSRKRQLYLCEQEENLITPLEIQLVLLQEKTAIFPMPSMHYELIQLAYTLSQAAPTSSLSKYLERLSLLHQRSNGKKITVMLEDSPQLLCFLYVLELILQETEFDEPIPLRKVFKFIDLSNTRLASQLANFPLLKFEQGRKNNQRSDTTAKLIKTLDFLTLTQASQSYFPMITGDPQTVNVLKLLNQRERLKLEEGQMKLKEQSSFEYLTELSLNNKTWIATPFFTEEELQQLYLSSAMREIVNDDQWYRYLWEKHARKEREENWQEEEVEQYCLEEISCYENFLLRNCPFMHQFQAHCAQVRDEEYREVLFAHFLFRKVTNIPLQATPTIFQELLATSQHNLLSTYLFLHNRAPIISQRLSHRLTFNSLALARQEAQRKLICHLCNNSFFPELMYTCRTEICRESFCLECLEQFRAYDQANLTKECWEDRTFIKLCPICRGLCVNCQSCQAKRESMTEKKECISFMLGQCHYCHKSSALLLYRCTSTACDRNFCLRCIEQTYRCRANEYKKPDWICFVCQDQCFCNTCEGEKRLMMSLVKETKRQNEPTSGRQREYWKSHDLEEKQESKTLNNADEDDETCVISKPKITRMLECPPVYQNVLQELTQQQLLSFHTFHL